MRVFHAFALFSVAIWPLAATIARAGEDPAAKPSVRVLVDPRVELLSIIFRLAGNPEYNQGRVESYLNDVESHFGRFRKHKVVDLARELRRTRGVSYDACMSMAVHLADAFEVKGRLPLEPRPASLDERWRSDEAGVFLEAARQFVQDSSFKEFIKNHRPLHDLTESRMKAMIEKEGHMEWFDNFFGPRPKSRFTLALGLVNGGCCYGARAPDQDGRDELFCILGVWRIDKEGKPEFTRDMFRTVVHEFCHSYANAIIDKHETELKAAGEKLFPPVAAKLRARAYGNWKTMFYESLVRACSLRYVRRYEGAAAAWIAAQQEKSRGFPWMGDLCDLLAKYESQRDQYPTLETFSPRIVEFFDQYAKKVPASDPR